MNHSTARGGFYDSNGRGLRSWIFSVDHKRIGLLYLATLLCTFAVGALFGLLMRLELLTAGPTIMDAQRYNSFFTMHGVTMLFFFIIPAAPSVFGNFFLPILIGAKDVAFPRLNLLSWWVFVLAICIAAAAFLTGSGPPDTGWTFYSPYSLRTSTNVLLGVVAVFVAGLSSILTGGCPVGLGG